MQDENIPDGGFFPAHTQRSLAHTTQHHLWYRRKNGRLLGRRQESIKMRHHDISRQGRPTHPRRVQLQCAIEDSPCAR